MMENSSGKSNAESQQQSKKTRHRRPYHRQQHQDRNVTYDFNDERQVMYYPPREQPRRGHSRGRGSWRGGNYSGYDIGQQRNYDYQSRHQLHQPYYEDDYSYGWQNEPTSSYHPRYNHFTSRAEPGSNDRGRGGNHRRQNRKIVKPTVRDISTTNDQTTSLAEQLSNGSVSNKTDSHTKPKKKAKENKGAVRKIDESQRDTLIEQLSSNKYECMVCFDVIRREAAIWSCDVCYHVFHIGCIKKWARTQKDDEGWRCPSCQGINSQFPKLYLCYCGKRTEPDHNRFTTPHGCGELCQRKRSEKCVHPCNILCHPGPCPPCFASIIHSCDCGKTKQSVRCDQQQAIKCTSPCEKTLNCGKHECKAVCHPGSCDPCDVEIEQICFCAKDKRKVVCGSTNSFVSSYTCEDPCQRALECSNHRCIELCHPGPCAECDLGANKVTHCQCGRTSIKQLGKTRSSCLDPIPVCTNVCDKPLACGPQDVRHLCKRLCHDGLCGPCSVEDGVTEVTCRCGIYQKALGCDEAEANPFTCDKRCNKKRQCGRHRCAANCCVREEHPCEMLCGRMLTCGIHRCDDPCHRGNCAICCNVSFSELSCHCGSEILFPPIACGTKPPECKRPCTREHACDHQVRHNCHSEEHCPPCVELVDRLCMGGHELRKFIRCAQPKVSCGMPCGRQLACGLHTCRLTCHEGPCVDESAPVCEQPCMAQRECGHPCMAPCHAGWPCPQSVCKAMVMLKCSCGNREMEAMCMAGSSHKQRLTSQGVSNVIHTRMTHAGTEIDISSLSSARVLACDTQCSIIERNKRVALALEIRNPDLSGKLAGTPNYSQELKVFALSNLRFTEEVQKALVDLVTSVQTQSAQPLKKHMFPYMNSKQRGFVHELAKTAYGVETMSFDKEPVKSVVAIATKGLCWLPNISLSDYVKKPADKGKTKRSDGLPDGYTSLVPKESKKAEPEIDYFDVTD